MFWKRTESLAEQQLASQEGLFFVTFIVSNCNDFTVIMVKMYKAATVLSALMTVYIIPCHDRGHINIMVVLQNCTDSLHILAGLSGNTYATSPEGTCDVSNTAVEEDVVVIEESFTAINKEVFIGIKQEETPEDISFPDIKTEPDEVSYVCVCLLLDTFYQCPEMSVFFVMPIFLAS